MRAFLALLACAAENLSASRFAEYMSLGQIPDAPAAAAPSARSSPAPTAFNFCNRDTANNSGTTKAVSSTNPAVPLGGALHSSGGFVSVARPVFVLQMALAGSVPPSDHAALVRVKLPDGVEVVVAVVAPVVVVATDGAVAPAPPHPAASERPANTAIRRAHQRPAVGEAA